MKLKGRSLLVLALLLFGGFAIFEYFQEKKTAKEVLEQARLVMVDYDQVESIILEKSLKKINLKRSIDGWSLLEPLNDFADNAAVEDFLKGVATERIIEVAKEGANIDWSLFGLDHPEGKITFLTSGGQKQSFQISNRKNFEQNTFVRRDSENRVLVVSSNWQQRLEKIPLEFRDRRFLRHRIATIDTFKLKNSTGILELKMKEGQWQDASNLGVMLDQNKVREMLQSISDAKAEDFVEGAKPRLKALFSLELNLGGKLWKADIGQAQDLKIYAEVSEPIYLLKMEPGALDKFIHLKKEELIKTDSNSKGKEKH